MDRDWNVIDGSALCPIGSGSTRGCQICIGLSWIGGLAVVWHCITLFDIESGCWIRLSMEWSPSGVRWLALDWNRIGTEL